MIDLELIRPEHLWYTVGLIVTDGNLSKDGRHINITSKDRRYLFSVRQALGLKIKIGRKSRGGSKIKIYSQLQFSDVKFYTYLLGLGLTPKKSLTLNKIKVADNYFEDFLRGVIDGDGSIHRWINKSNGYEQWALRVVSASEKFIYWLQKKCESQFKVIGKVYMSPKREDRNELYLLKFGKIAAKIILKKCYYNNSLSLNRKLQKSIKCLQSRNGWGKYRTMKSPGAEIGIQNRLKID